MVVFLYVIGVIGWVTSGSSFAFGLYNGDQLTTVLAAIGALTSTVMFVGGAITGKIQKHLPLPQRRPEETGQPSTPP